MNDWIGQINGQQARAIYIYEVEASK